MPDLNLLVATILMSYSSIISVETTSQSPYSGIAAA
jgi:hypothetical protein